MHIQTVLGSSIQAALAEARATLGDNVVLLESVGAEGDQPARITVMVDARPLTRPAPVAAAPVVSGGPEPEPEPPAPMPFGYAARPAATPRRPLFPSAPSAALSAPAPAPPAVSPKAPPAAIPDALAERFAALEARLEGAEALGAQMARLEALLAAPPAAPPAFAPPGAPVHPLGAHPLASALARLGLPPELAARLLGAAGARGIGTGDGSREALEAAAWALAHELRTLLTPTAPPRYTADTLVAIGPAGAGKTTLLLRLATDSCFFGRRAAGVLLAEPEDFAGATAVLRPDPAPLYAQYGLPVQTVHTAEDLRDSLDALRGVDVLLIDTPPLPAAPDAAAALLASLAEILAPLTSREVVLALDATRARAADPAVLAPLRPTLAALTRLDETDDWGRAAGWIEALGCPVGFASAAGEGGLRAYTPTWFAEAFAERLVAAL